MTEGEERAYECGVRAVRTEMLRECLRALGYNDEPQALAARLAIEREAAVAALRNVCSKYGNNEWPDDLFLADIIEKRLGRVLDARPTPVPNVGGAGGSGDTGGAGTTASGSRPFFGGASGSNGGGAGALPLLSAGGAGGGSGRR